MPAAAVGNLAIRRGVWYVKKVSGSRAAQRFWKGGDTVQQRPLADEIRPRTLDEVVGQKHLLGPGAVLRRLIESGTSANMSVDKAGFEELMEQQRVRARKAREALGDVAWAGIDLGLDATPTTFTGYDHSKDEGRVLAIVVDEELRDAMMATIKMIKGRDRPTLMIQPSTRFSPLRGKMPCGWVMLRRTPRGSPSA